MVTTRSQARVNENVSYEIDLTASGEEDVEDISKYPRKTYSTATKWRISYAVLVFLYVTIMLLLGLLISPVDEHNTTIVKERGGHPWGIGGSKDHTIHTPKGAVSANAPYPARSDRVPAPVPDDGSHEKHRNNLLARIGRGVRNRLFSERGLVRIAQQVHQVVRMRAQQLNTRRKKKDDL